MTVFWIAALALAGLAAAFVLAPLVRGREAGGDSALRKASNTRIFEDRRAEIRADAASGELTEDDARALETELARSLLRDAGDSVAAGAGAGDNGPVAVRDRGRGLLVAGAVATPLLALLLYADWGLSLGALADLELSRDVAVLDRPEGAAAPSQGAAAGEVADLERRLAARLAGNPDDVDGWFLLGRTRLNLEDFSGAADAFGEIADRLPDTPGPRIYQAQARYMADGRQVTPAVRALIDRVLALTPGEPVVLELLAMDAFQNERYAQAAELFEQVLGSGVEDEARRRFLADGLTRARALAGMPPLPASAPETEGPGIDVAIEVDPALVADAGPEAALFVLARAVGGSPMPLAVERHPVTRSLRVRLDADDAMSPALSIATVDRVEIVARLSRSGTAARGGGDVEATAGPLGTTGAVRLSLSAGGSGGSGEVLRDGALAGGAGTANAAATAASSVGAPAAANAAPAASAAAGAQESGAVRVLVELDGSLSAPADATLFVFAREIDGSPMPLAVTRLSAAALPTLVTLDDSMAMVPGRTLSAAGTVEIVARISRGGGVGAQPGDLEGIIGPVDPSAATRVLPLLVDRIVD